MRLADLLPAFPGMLPALLFAGLVGGGIAPLMHQINGRDESFGARRPRYSAWLDRYWWHGWIGQMNATALCPRQPHMRRPIRVLFRRLLLVAATCVLPTSGNAHRATLTSPTSGMSIPSITHGQMGILANYRGAILDLADRQSQTDRHFRGLLVFVGLQHLVCLGDWSLATSPTRTAHSTNAPMRTSPRCKHCSSIWPKCPLAQDPAHALIADIERDMLGNSTSLVLCLFSDTPFNTADVIFPAWNGIPYHLPTLLRLSGPH